jgi:hypothetical protein
VTNEGRKCHIKDSFGSPEKIGGPKHKKKVVSKPIENINTVIDVKPNLAMTYELTKANQQTLA